MKIKKFFEFAKEDFNYTLQILNGLADNVTEDGIKYDCGIKYERDNGDYLLIAINYLDQDYEIVDVIDTTGHEDMAFEFYKLIRGNADTFLHSQFYDWLVDVAFDHNITIDNLINKVDLKLKELELVAEGYNLVFENENYNDAGYEFDVFDYSFYERDEEFDGSDENGVEDMFSKESNASFIYEFTLDFTILATDDMATIIAYVLFSDGDPFDNGQLFKASHLYCDIYDQYGDDMGIDMDEVFEKFHERLAKELMSDKDLIELTHNYGILYPILKKELDDNNATYA